MTEEEKKARELRRKERERRHREGKDKTKPSKRIDLIDQLDHTGIYGLSRKCQALPVILPTCFTDHLQSSTTMVHSMLATPTATAKAAAVRPCRHLRKGR